MEDVKRLIEIIEGTKEGLQSYNSNRLKELSDQTITQASSHQDISCIALAVLIYTLSKLVERQDYKRIKTWDKFVKKFISYLDLATRALNDDKEEKYDDYLEMARKAITSISVNLKPYIQEVMRKASINKASKIYEHGISMGRTAKMLGITQWELSEYTGQRNIVDNPYNETISVKKRAQTAMEFFK